MLNFILLIFGLCTSLSNAQQVGQIVLDEFVEVPGVSSARGYGITTDSQGRTFVSGAASDRNGVVHWFVRLSEDGGTTWKVSDRYLPTGAAFSSAISITTGPKDEIVVAGYVNSNGQNSGVTRATFDSGKTWETIDTFADQRFKSSVYYRPAVGPNSEIILTGFGSIDFSGVEISKWISRISKDGGRTWTTFDFLNNFDDPNMGGESLGVLSDRDGNIWLTASELTFGNSEYPRSVSHAYRLDLATDQLSSVDSYQYDGSRGGWISLYQSKVGDIYLVGSGWRTDEDGEPREKQTRECILRKSSDQGATWNDVSHFSLSDRNAECYSMAENSDSLFVTGYAMDDGARYHSILRKSVDNGATWSTTYDDVGVENRGAYGYSMNSFSDRVFQTGWYYTSFGSVLRTLEVK